MNRLEEARAYFQNDHFATENGAVIDEIGEDCAVCSLNLEEHHRNALGNVMGGAVFMLADFAFAVASNFGRHPSVTVTSQITFLRAAKGDRLSARAECVKDGRSVIYYETTVTDGTGAVVARVTSSGSVVG